MGKIQEIIIQVDDKLRTTTSQDAVAELEEILQLLIKLRDCSPSFQELYGKV